MTLDAPPGKYFIIGDRPVVWGYNQLKDDGWSMSVDVPPSALRNPNVQLIAPLTRSIALFAFHASSPSPQTIWPDDVNTIVARGSHRWIAGPTKATVEAALGHNCVA